MDDKKRKIFKDYFKRKLEPEKELQCNLKSGSFEDEEWEKHEEQIQTESAQYSKKCLGLGCKNTVTTKHKHIRVCNTCKLSELYRFGATPNGESK